MEFFKKVYITTIFFLFRNTQLTNENSITDEDTDGCIFSAHKFVRFNETYANKINDKGKKIESIGIFAYLDGSKIKSDSGDKREVLRIEKGALKVIVLPLESEEDVNDLEKKNLLGYLKLQEDWVSEPRVCNYCAFKGTPVFKWEKQLVLENLDIQGSLVNDGNATFSEFELSVLRIWDKDNYKKPLLINEKVTWIAFSFNFLHEYQIFFMERTKKEKEAESVLEKFTGIYELSNTKDFSERTASSSIDCKGEIHTNK